MKEETAGASAKSQRRPNFNQRIQPMKDRTSKPPIAIAPKTQIVNGEKLARWLRDPAKRHFIQADLLSGRILLAKLTTTQVTALSLAHETTAKVM
jgi:hypothetical protein